MNVVFLSDERYLHPLAVAIESFLSSLAADEVTLNPKIFIIEAGIPEHEKQLLQEWITRKGARLAFTTPQAIPGFSAAPLVWQKLFLPTLLPEDVEVVLYLDSDILVRRSSALVKQFSLFQKSIAQAKEESPLIQAVQDIGHPVGCFFSSDARFERVWQFPPPPSYFNAGVLFMNLKAFRAR